MMWDRQFIFSMKLYLLIGVIVAMLVAGAYRMQYPVAPNDDSMYKDQMMKKDNESLKPDELEKDAKMKKNEYPEQSEKMMEKSTGDGSMMEKSVTGAGMYKVTTGTPVAGLKNVLFFHASWCPTCRAADADISAKLSSIPAGLIIHKVDYDTATDLKKKYGVTYQHTFVQVDEKGEMITKWSGGDLAMIIEKTK